MEVAGWVGPGLSEICLGKCGIILLCNTILKVVRQSL